MDEGEAAPSVPATPSHNPGTYEELNWRCKNVFPMCFEGARVAVNKGLSQHFQISHTLSISPMTTGYKFGATYVGTNVIGPGEAYPVILGDTDASGNTSATIIHQFKNNIRMKLQSQVQQGLLSAAQGSFELRGRLATATLMMANTDLVNESGVIVGQYLRRMTERFDVGAELIYHYGRHAPGGQASSLSYAARYTHPHFTGSMVLGTGSLNLSYYHKQNPDLSFGVEYDVNMRTQESVASIAYQAELPEARVTMRASIDTNWIVGAVLEKQLSEALPFKLAISGLIDHVKNTGKFGIGLIIG